MQIFIYPILSIFFLLMGCVPHELKDLDQMVLVDPPKVKSVHANFCTMDALQVKSKLKFLFVLDKSGSNQKRSDDNGVFLPSSGNDMLGERRYNPIIDFINSTPEDETIYYGLINFATTAVIAKNFTNNRTNFATFIANEKTADGGVPRDTGWTNYLAALDQIGKIIDNDSNLEKNSNPNQIVSSHYIIFFITDGAPITNRDDQGNKVIQGKNPDGTDMIPQPVYQAIDSIIARNKVPDDGSTNNSAWIDSIQIHTGYYYSPLPGQTQDDDDPIAREYLQKMAEKGMGAAYEFSGSDVIDFHSFKIPQRNIEHILEDVLVVNMNTLWNGEKKILDTDGDGLSDDLEILLGSNPQQKDSDNNGVSDGVEYRVFGKPCNGANCEINLAKNVSPTCNAASKATDLDKDGLSNCEEIILGSRVDLFDSNFDELPDDLALRFNLGLIPDRGESAQENPDQDNDNTYREIKYDTPHSFHNGRIVGLIPQDYKLELMSTNEQKKCYRLLVTNIKELPPKSMIRIYVREKTVLNNKSFLRRAEKESNTGDDVIFEEVDFQ